MKTSTFLFPIAVLSLASFSVFDLVKAEAAAPAPGANAGKMQPLASPNQTPDGLSKSDWAGIRAAYEAGRHGFQSVEGGWQAWNPGQRWTTKFDRRGFEATPQGGGWTWGLELQSYGAGAAQVAVAGLPSVRAEGQRLTYQWDVNVQEWWVNDPRGLEHGFTVARRPEQSEPAALTFALNTRGNLAPKVTPDAKGVVFADAAGAAVLNYTGLKVWDADGKILAARFEPAVGKTLRLVVDDAAARYPVTIDPIAQQAYLKASNPGEGDFFGGSVAISGDTVVVGAWNENSSATGVNSTPNEDAEYSGAAYVFVRSGGVWSQQAFLKASNAGTGDVFGTSVAISGDTIVVGAYGEGSSTTGVNSTPNDDAEYSGAAYVFVRSGGVWSQQAYLKASNTEGEDEFGVSVAVSGDTVVVGARSEDSGTTGVNSSPNDNARNAGAAYVFSRSGSTWSQQAYLKASNSGRDDEFGKSVAVSGDTVIVGAYAEGTDTGGVNPASNNNAIFSGAAYVFTRSGSAWSQQAFLKASNAQSFDYFGRSVAISGDTAIVGAPQEDGNMVGGQEDASAPNSGAAYVFTRSGNVWSQQAYLKAGNLSAFDQFGSAVAISGDTAVVGAWGEDSSSGGVNSTPNEAAGESGAAYIFTRTGNAWSQDSYLKASNTGVSDNFGTSVAVSGDSVVVGAINEDSSTMGVNSAPDEGMFESGAAYIFNISAAPPNAAPTDIALSSASIAENNAANATVGTLSATDADAGQTHAFALVSGAGDTDNAAFSISGNTLAINAAADFETKSSYAIRIRATDNGSPTASYEEAFTINITDVFEDMTPPVVGVPATIIVEATSAAGAEVTFTTTALDAVDGARPTTDMPASGSTFAIGNTTVNVSATDAAGNIGYNSFTVTVQDTTPPNIEVPADISETIAQGATSKVVNFTTTATDDVDGAVTVTASPASGSSFSLGETTVTLTATDSRGNTATETFTVTVDEATIADLLAAAQGYYFAGRIHDVNNGVVGYSILKFGSAGSSVTGRVYMNGGRYAVNATLNANGRATKNLTLSGYPTIAFVLQLSSDANGLPIISADSASTGKDGDATLVRGAYQGATPANVAGKWSVLLPGSTLALTGTKVPSGSGYASMDVAASGGVITMTGKTHNNTVFTVESLITDYGFEIYTRPKPSGVTAGLITGSATFDDLTDSDFSGNISITRNVGGTGPYAGGFTGAGTIIGCRYTPAAAGTLPLPFTSTLLGINFQMPDKAAVENAPFRITPGTPITNAPLAPGTTKKLFSLKTTATASTGVILGTRTTTAVPPPTTIGGIIYPKGARVEGFALDATSNSVPFTATQP